MSRAYMCVFRPHFAPSVLVFAAGALGALAACSDAPSDDPDPSEVIPDEDIAQDVTCNPRLTWYPVRGRHNNGYDSQAGNSSLWTCNADRSNSDFVAGDHLGNDIWAAEGTPVVATVSGTATLVGFSSYSGNKVTIIDSCGWYHFSTHLKSIAPGITNGKRIDAGTVIGYVGKSGTASNGVIHLHYSIYPNGNYDAGINPWPYLKAVENDVCNLPSTTPSPPPTPSHGADAERVVTAANPDLAASRNSDGRLELFYTTPAAALNHSWQLAPNGNWSGGAGL